MNLVNHNVVVINPDSSNYNKVGFCKAHEKGIYLVQFKNEAYAYREKDIKLVEVDTKEDKASPKSSIKSGDLVIDEHGNKYRAFLEYEDKFEKGVLVKIGRRFYLPFKDFSNDLKLPTPYGSYSIEKIYTPKTPLDYNTDGLTRYDLKWSREKTKEMTLEEIQDALGILKRILIIKGE